MKRFFNWIVGLFSYRRSWVRQITVAAIASATAWVIGDNLVFKGGLVAAIVCALSIRISLYKSIREGLGQIVGTAIGAGVALLTVHYFSFGVVAIGLTGVMARCTGIKRDIRMSKLETYANYYHLNFRTYTGQNGDSYDRYLLRMNEMAESLYIVNQVTNKLTSKKTKKINLNPLNLLKSLDIKSSNFQIDKTEYSSMEKLIKHFKYWSEGFVVKPNWTYQAVESPKGEFGVTLVSDGSNKPYKCKVRSPAYHHLQALPKISKGHYLADLAALIGTIDIVFGEIDR